MSAEHLPEPDLPVERHDQDAIGEQEARLPTSESLALDSIRILFNEFGGEGKRAHPYFQGRVSDRRDRWPHEPTFSGQTRVIGRSGSADVHTSIFETGDDRRSHMRGHSTKFLPRSTFDQP